MKYTWWYHPIFLFVEMIQAMVGLLTLTYYRPSWTITFAKWYANRRAWRELSKA
jgi:hypothetical protein